MSYRSADFLPGDIVHIDLGCGITRRYAVIAARSRHLDLRDPLTGIQEQRTYDQVALLIHNNARPARPRNGDYFEALEESQRAGTAWTCRCGCPNPGIWDCCQKCQHPGNV